MALLDNYADIFGKVDLMTGTELRAYWFRLINGERIFEGRAVDFFCLGGGCDEFLAAGDEIAQCRGGDDGLYSPRCERYWEVSEWLRGLICADLIARRTVGDE